jgi:uncharacterized protein (DUF427 family)
MSAKAVKVPGPEHPITVTKNPKRVVVTAGGKTIADTKDALSLQEASYPAVQYIPRKDADMTLLERTDHSSHCPYKGGASYYSIPSAGAKAINAVWSYENPHAAMAQIKDYLAFYPDRVDSIAER